MKPYSKHKNKPVVIDDIWFRSTKEGKRYQELKLLEKAGEITHLRLQTRFPITIDGQLVCTYVADFTYRENGKSIVEDVKGRRLPMYQLKKKLLWITQRISILET